MKSKLFYLLALSLPIGLVAKPFEATGKGETFEEARHNAVANAIKFSVGEYVESEELLKNNDLKQRITLYSNTYIKRSKVLSQKKEENQYTVNVEVDLDKQEVVGVLKTIKSSTSTMNKALSTKIDNQIDAYQYNEKMLEVLGDVIEEVLITPILSGKTNLTVEPEELDFIKITEDGNLLFKYPVKFSINRNYNKAIQAILKELQGKGEPVQVSSYRLSSIEKEVDLSPININKKKLNILSQKLEAIQNIENPITLSLLDSNGKEIRKLSYSTSGELGDKNFIIEDNQQNYLELFKRSLYPSAKNNHIRYYTGTVKLDLLFIFSQDEYKYFKENGKIVIR